MAADIFHHRVEQSMKIMGKKFYDFQYSVTKDNQVSSKQRCCLRIRGIFFVGRLFFSSTYKLRYTVPQPYLQNLLEVVFTRGLKILTYKSYFSANEFF